MISAPDWEPGFDELWDLTAAHQVDVSPEELEALVSTTRENAERFGKNRVAVSSPSDTVAVLIRLYGQLTKAVGRTLCTVRTRADAEAWLAGDDGVCVL